MTTELTIDKEFSALCPGLTPEELNLLETSITADGCRDPIVVWANHDDTILDGHNRYRICTTFEVPFKTRAVKLASREDAINWIIANQLGRRNLTENQKDYLRGKRYLAEKKDVTNPTGKSGGGQNVHKPKTAEKIAAEYDVDEKTIRRDAKFAEAVDRIEDTLGTDAKNAVLQGRARKQDVIAVAELPKGQQKKAVAAMSAGEKEELAKALGKTPQQAAEEDPGRRWNAGLHKLYVLLNSVRDNGGMKKLARKWAEDQRKAFIVELKRIIGEINKLIAILEETK